jgi:hypothetical protein
MILNIIKRRYLPFIVLIFLLHLVFLASCSDDGEDKSGKMTTSADSHALTSEEADASADSQLLTSEEIAAILGKPPKKDSKVHPYDELSPEEALVVAAALGIPPENVSELPTREELSFPEMEVVADAIGIPFEDFIEPAAGPADGQLSLAETEDLAATFGGRPEDYLKAEGSINEYLGELMVQRFGRQETNRIDEYRVVLGADEKIRIPGLPGELRVWIGSPSHKPDFPDDMVKDETAIPAVGESATVQPFAPAFKIDPIKTQCIKIHPSGSEVRFKLTPQKQGTFEVGADVHLFDSSDCSGSPIPKTTSTMKVLVEVNQKENFLEKVNELWNILWEKFVEFWAALLVIFFGVILFFIRVKLKKWFGYEGD